ncbi:hypothetical protein [Alistipes shahii]|uniref:hypothetical protein n=1 Tax=Alistipes shahii TaxID=328814 RepID=UPI00266D6BF6|nr:hypothetical protein [Alistipes shahii]
MPTRPAHLGRHYDKRSISNFGVHCDIGCEYRISYRVGVSYTFYAGSCRLPGIQSSTRTRSGVNGGLRFYF